MRVRVLWLCVLVSALGFSRGTAWGQAADAADAALRDRVAQLVDRLNAPKAETKDAAEKSLIDLGPRVLPLLPDAANLKDPEHKKRLEKVRSALQEAEAQINLGASKVTIHGKGIRLSDAIRQLQTQTGNPISDMREQMGEDVTNPAFDLDITDMPFFEALELVARKAEVGTTFFSGDGSIGIVGAAAMPKT
ncbi:MAG TPA: hypothetical protein VGY53_12220, partial [Isosphaeraceae bacterium]|nr:hypothetical protein [Isosphaeraceae bacterium]